MVAVVVVVVIVVIVVAVVVDIITVAPGVGSETLSGVSSETKSAFCSKVSFFCLFVDICLFIFCGTFVESLFSSGFYFVYCLFFGFVVYFQSFLWIALFLIFFCFICFSLVLEFCEDFFFTPQVSSGGQR